MKRISRGLAPLFIFAVAFGVFTAPPAMADHTNPREPILPTEPGFPGETPLITGEGTWELLANFPYPPVDGGGSDHKFFTMEGDIYAAVGTLGQHDAAIGQRILKLTEEGTVNPTWVADHGSAACPPANASVTGLQHDQAFLGTISKKMLKRIEKVPARSLVVTPEVMLDATDATGRCHDPVGGGIELVDISELTDPAFEPREIHLVRHAGTSHTVTVDDARPWIYYNNTSNGSGTPWIDVVDTRSCLGLAGLTLEEKRERCRPKVYRLPYKQEWSPAGATCHDLTSRGNLIYCAALNTTLIFDVGGIVKKKGGLKGRPLACELTAGTMTGAMVTDCSAIPPPEEGQETSSLGGFRFLGTVPHDGTLPPTEDIATAHQAYPTPDKHWMFVTDERGGGVVPPGATCVPGVENPQGNGGIHVFDISDPKNIEYALTPDGAKAVWIAEPQIPSPSFCTVHVIEQMVGEQRFAVGYYTQGAKVLDWWVDEEGQFTFRETASIILPNANVWSVSPFKIEDHGDGTKTYYMIASDINRGIDVLSWTGPSNPIGTPPPAGRAAEGSADPGLLMLALFSLPALIRARRRLA
ncbi:MAG: hypothetical protein ACRDH6_04290 [Actinomycetota bacterium]